MGQLTVAACFALAVSSLASGGSSASDPAWLDADRRYQLVAPHGPAHPGYIYSDTSTAALETQLLQLKAERLRGTFADEVASPAESTSEGWRRLEAEAAVRQPEDQEAAPSPAAVHACCTAEHSAGDLAADLARQLVNYARARAVDDVLRLLERALSSPLEWSHVRHKLRELEDELGAYQGAGGEETADPSRRHDGRGKMKKHKEKGVKKKPRHKEKVKIKGGGAGWRGEPPGSAGGSGERHAEYGVAADGPSLSLSPLEELVRKLSSGGDDGRNATRRRTGTAAGDVPHRKHDDEVVEVVSSLMEGGGPRSGEPLEKVSDRLQRLRTELEHEEEFLRVFHDDLTAWGEQLQTTTATTTTTPTTTRPPPHAAAPGRQPPRRRLFAYHRVTASPRLRAPPHSAYVAVSVVSPAAAVRGRATTAAPADGLEQQLLRLASETHGRPTSQQLLKV